MSSVIKKTTHFVPKLKKSGLKKKVVRKLVDKPVTGLDSPSSTQTEEPTVTDDISKDDQMGSLLADEVAYLPATPAATQASPEHSSYSINEVDEDEVDPKDVTAKSNKPHEEDDIFRAPSEHRRQFSVLQRRLSGITPPVLKSRSASVSSEPETHTPAKIGIPIAKSKRRRSLVARVRRVSAVKETEAEPEPEVVATPPKPARISVPTRIVPKEPSPELSRETTPTNSLIAALRETDAEFVVGIDPNTQKLTKFRLRAEPHPSDLLDRRIKLEGEILNLPLAPDNLITSISGIHQLPRSVDDSDVKLYSEVSLDINNMTMSDLCKPTLPFGRVSANFESVKAAQKTIHEKRKQRSQDRVTAREQRISLVEVARINGTAEVEDEEAEEEARKKRKLKDLELDDDSTVSSSLQLMIAPDGKISYDTDSAVVSRHSRLDNSSLSREVSNPFENPVTSFTYSKRSHTDRWTAEEVEQFYEALSMLGTDFSLIAQIFPYRTRKQIKLKFNLEEKKYPEIIAAALKRKLPANFKDYCTVSKKEIKSMEFYNEQLKQVRVQHEAHMALIESERERAYKEDAEASRRREIEIRTGAKPMTRTEKIKELRKNQLVVGSIDDAKKNK